MQSKYIYFLFLHFEKKQDLYKEFRTNIFFMASLLLLSFKCCNLSKNLQKQKEFDNEIKNGLNV